MYSEFGYVPILNLDMYSEFWLNLDQDSGLCFNFEEKKI